jgi:hypothetical protein
MASRNIALQGVPARRYSDAGLALQEALRDGIP